MRLVRFGSLPLLFAVLGVCCGTAFPSEAGKTQGSFELQRTFGTIRLNEKDLAKLVEIVDQLPRKFGGNVEIQVTSGDGGETVKTTDPKYFSSSEMLGYIRAVQIGYQQFLEPTCSVRLTIGSVYDWGGFGSGTELDVNGTDQVAVFGIFHELERELESHQAPIEWFGADLSFFEFMLNVLVGVLLGTLAAVSLIIVLNFVGRFVPSVQPSQVFGAIVSIAFFVCAFGSIALLHKCFGPVRFTGLLSDPSSAISSYSTAIVVFVLSPIAVNIFSALITRFRPAPMPPEKS